MSKKTSHRRLSKQLPWKRVEDIANREKDDMFQWLKLHEKLLKEYHDPNDQQHSNSSTKT